MVNPTLSSYSTENGATLGEITSFSKKEEEIIEKKESKLKFYN